MKKTQYTSFTDLIKQESKALWVFVFYTILLLALWHYFDLKHWLLNLQNLDWPWYVGPGFAWLYVLRGFFYFPSLYFIIAASLLFPFPFSALYYLAGVYSSAALSYSIGHHVRKGAHFSKLLQFVERPEISHKIRTDGLRAVWWFHLTGISLDIPNYLSGYLRLPFAKFMCTIIIANLITTALYFTLFLTGLFNLQQYLAS